MKTDLKIPTDSQTASNAWSSRELPIISVIILNYNGQRWLRRCLNSVAQQTIFAGIEVIVADNDSPDGSDLLAAEIMQNWTSGRVLQHGRNLGYCEGNNVAARQAKGHYLFFLNNDTWLEPDCLETLLKEVERVGAAAATPLVMNYDDDSFQSLGALGFDLFGLVTSRCQFQSTREVLMPEGCSFLVRRDVFERVGGFDAQFFMFSDETDLSWRIWIAGFTAVAVPRSRLHHRGAAQVNPRGGGKVVEFRTSDTKRFYANRNGLLLVLKNAQHFLLLLFIAQVALLCVEAVVGLLLTRRWTFVRHAYLGAIHACWRLRAHIVEERRQIQRFRIRTDWWMVRFLRLRPNRWDELVRLWRTGLPTVTEDARNSGGG